MKAHRTSVIAAGVLAASFLVPAAASAAKPPMERKEMKDDKFPVVPPGKIKPSKFQHVAEDKGKSVAVPELGAEGLFGAAILLLGSGLLLAQRRRKAAA